MSGRSRNLNGAVSVGYRGWFSRINCLGDEYEKGRPDSRPPSRSRLRQGGIISSQDEPLSPLPPPGALGPPLHAPAMGVSPSANNSNSSNNFGMLGDQSLALGAGGGGSAVVPATETTPLSIQFTRSGHYSKMLSTLNEMRLSREQCDITLQVGAERLSAHKLILVANSPYFRAMFSCSYSEGTQSSVEMHDISFVALELLVGYFYTCKIHISTDNVQDVLSASTLLQMGVVTDACCEFMRRHLGVTNCLGVRSFADMHSCSDLERTAAEYSRHNFVTVVESEEFLKLELDRILELLSATDLAVPSEESVFEACMKWVKFDPAKRDRFIVDILEKVRGEKGPGQGPEEEDSLMGGMGCGVGMDERLGDAQN